MFKALNQLSGNSFEINDGESVLDAAIRQGVNLPYGCRNGFCGKCKSVILDGEIQYPGKRPPGISESETNEGFALLCQCRASSDLTIASNELEPEIGNIPIRKLPCKVQEIEHLNHDVVKVVLKTPESDSLQYLAGQYIDLQYKDMIPRSFSVANEPKNSSLIELHIRLIEDGEFTNFIFKELKEKTLLSIEGPRGDFYLREKSTKPIIFVAGGTGFGPVKAIIEHIISSKNNRQIFIYWGVRDEKDIYMKTPYNWEQDHQNITFIPVLSEANKGWSGRTGFVHEAVVHDFDSLKEYEVYACGPPVMVKSAANSFVEKGLSKDSFFSDSFDFVKHEDE